MTAFAHEPHPAPTSAADRAARIGDPGFGRVFTDHMITVRYTGERGWHDATLHPRRPLSLDPATAVLHYAQEIFEGMKAYALADANGEEGGIALFRPEQNARRFNASARRMAMPEVPEELFLSAVRELVLKERDWIPDGEGSLYLRPFMIASEVFLGVKPANEYLFMVLASSAGAYFRGGAPTISLFVSEDYTRAAPGGTGAAKCGGNYATSLVAQAEATRRGCDQVVFLDAVERKWVDELGGMNIFFVRDGKTLITPPLGTILPGITRDSILQIARDEGLEAFELPYSIDDWRAEATSGRLTEAFACGTAAVVAPIGRVVTATDEFTIGGGGPGQLSQRLKDRLTAIQRGRAPDPHDWVQRIA
ncbi:MAG: branched-chain amino acid aminotransferase [Pseudomonadota bacterium]